MKKIFSALFITLFGAAAFMTSCSDVPAPYDIKLPGDVELVGDGTKENPYNVATAAMKQDGSTAWVQGYIVGVMETNVDPFSPSFTAPFSTNSNIMIADSPEEQSKKNCLMVQLPIGDIRTALNLVDHAENRTKPVMLEGKLTAYFSEAGLKEVSAGVFNGEDIGEGGGETPEGNIIFEEKFDGTKGNFTIHDVTLPAGSDRVWKEDKYQDKPGYMKASAFVNNTNYAAESWLVSPNVDLSTCKTAYLTFMHAHRFGVDKTKEMTVWVTEAGKEEWKQVTIPTYASGKDWTLVSAGKIDLNAYVGKKMQFMFKYVSTTEGAPTWEVNNVQVIGDGEGGGEIPTPGEEVEVTTDKPYEEKFETGLGAFSINDKNIGELTFVWKHDAQYKYMKASAFKDGAQATESWLVSPILNLTSLSKAVLSFEQAVNHSKGKAADYLTLIAAEAGTENWEKVTITYPESDSWNFVPSGEIDLTKYAGKKIQLAFKYTSSTEIAATWEIKNVKVAAGDGGGEVVPPTPGDENLLTNGDFETWSGEAPEGWGRESVTNSTYTQSTDAKSGKLAVSISGSSANARFGSQDITLPAGTYTLSVFAKNAAGTANFRMGWVPIENGSPNSSKYSYILDSTVLSNEWQKYTSEFTLSAETTISIFFVNSKSKEGNDLLVDQVRLQQN